MSAIGQFSRDGEENDQMSEENTAVVCTVNVYSPAGQLFLLEVWNLLCVCSCSCVGLWFSLFVA